METLAHDRFVPDVAADRISPRMFFPVPAGHPRVDFLASPGRERDPFAYSAGGAAGIFPFFPEGTVVGKLLAAAWLFYLEKTPLLYHFMLILF